MLSIITWFVSSLFLKLDSPDRLLLSLLLFIISFLFGIYWSIIGITETLQLVFALYDNELIRDLVKEISRYKAQSTGRGLLIESTLDRALRAIASSTRNALNGKMEIRYTDFAADTYRDALSLQDVQRVYATNFMPQAWTGPLGQAIIQGNSRVLQRGGSITRIFLLGMTPSSRELDARMIGADKYIRAELEALVGKKKTDKYYHSRCICRSSERVHENFFIIDDRAVVKTEVDPSGRPARLVIMESKDEIEHYKKEFDSLCREKEVREDEFEAGKHSGTE